MTPALPPVEWKSKPRSRATAAAALCASSTKIRSAPISASIVASVVLPQTLSCTTDRSIGFVGSTSGPAPGSSVPGSAAMVNVAGSLTREYPSL